MIVVTAPVSLSLVMPHGELATVVLGSQSPRRRELLGSLVGCARLQVVVPRMESEPGFEGIATLEGVAAQLKHIARLKYQDVGGQVAHTDHPPCVVAADTVIVAFEADVRPVVLGKPPEDEPELVRTVRDWFARYYAGRRHLAMSCVCVGMVGATPREVVVTTEVWFRADALDFIDWYLATDEPRGKAGGYAIQEAGSLFVERIAGSLSNVVGLPLVETARLLRQAGAMSP